RAIFSKTKLESRLILCLPMHPLLHCPSIPFRPFLEVMKVMFNRRSFLKTLGTAAASAPFVTRGLMAQSPNSILRHASFGSAGQAWSDINELAKCKTLKLVAVAEVDLNRTADLKKKFHDAKI